MQHSHLDWASESSHSSLNEKDAAEIVLPIDELVDELRKTRASFTRICWFLGADPKEVRTSDSGHVVGKSREAARLPKELQPFISHSLEFIDEDRAMPINVGNLRLEHRAS